MRLLLVEDDHMIGRAVRQGLVQAGFAVDWVSDGVTAETSLSHNVHQLVILDLGLPRKDGMSLLRDLRARNSSVPVLVLTARDALSDKVAGLNAGADDYLLKPFDLDELTARVRALLRRSAGCATPQYSFGALSLDPVRKVVTLRGAPVSLSAREFALLETLMVRPGAVLSRRQLEDAVYGWFDSVGSNAVEVHLHNLRRKLGTHSVRNVRGVGYCVGLVE